MIRRLIFIFVLIFAAIACGHIDGYQGDTIKLSKTRHTFEAAGGNIEITTKGEHWENGDVKVDGSETTYYPQELERLAELQGNQWPRGIMVPDTIKGPWFWVARPELKKLVIHTDPNTSDQQRKFTLALPDLDYRGFVYITQKAAK